VSQDVAVMELNPSGPDPQSGKRNREQGNDKPYLDSAVIRAPLFFLCHRYP